ncbi:MAG: DUF5615 family PIN-like protein [Limisphaerales bacterium]
MSLLFLCDQCVPEEVRLALDGAGHRAIRLREVLPIRSPDGAVLAKAREMGAVLVSLNGDFADIVAYPPETHAGIIALQLHNHPEVIPGLMRHLMAHLATHPDPDHFRGRLFIVEAHRIRVRG